VPTLSIKPAMPLSIDGTNGQMTDGYIDSAGLMPIEARGNYLPKPPYLRETKTYHSQPLESIRHESRMMAIILSRYQ